MKYSGRYCKIEDGFNLDEAINEEIEIATKIISRLKEDLTERDFNIIMKNLSVEYLNAIKL